MRAMPSCCKRSEFVATQINPRPFFAMKLTTAGEINCAAMITSPSFSRSASSTTMTILPLRISATTDSIESNFFSIGKNSVASRRRNSSRFDLLFFPNSAGIAKRRTGSSNFFYVTRQLTRKNRRARFQLEFRVGRKNAAARPARQSRSDFGEHGARNQKQHGGHQDVCGIAAAKRRGQGTERRGGAGIETD